MWFAFGISFPDNDLYEKIIAGFLPFYKRVILKVPWFKVPGSLMWIHSGTLSLNKKAQRFLNAPHRIPHEVTLVAMEDKKR